MNKFNHVMTKGSLTLLMLTTLGGAGSVFAAQTPGTDASADRTLTIHANAGNDTQANAEQNKTGQNNDAMNNVNPMENVKFSVTQVKPTGSAADMTADDTSTFTTVDGGFTASGTTDSNGATTIDFGSNNDGYYLVHQVTTSGGITTMKDFIVQIPLNLSGVTEDGGWNYDVNVYPKLDMDKDTGTDKGVGGFGVDDSDKQESAFAGQDVTWNLATVFSQTLRSKNDDGSYQYGTFKLTDKLSEYLSYKSIDFSVGLQNTTDNNFSNVTDLKLTEGTDYTLDYSGADENGYGGTVTFMLTNSGIDKVMDAYITPGDNERFMFIPNLTTTVSSDYKYGQIGNSFTGDIENSYGVDISPNPSNPSTPPTTPPGTTNPPGETPEVFLGGVRVKKVDSSSQTSLAGATFAIATTEANAKAGKYVQKAADGKLYASIDEVPDGVTTTDYKVTSGTDGLAEFVGLSLTDFNTPGNGTDVSQANTDYWIVETEAPKGYDKLPDPIKATASIDPTTVEADVNNNLSGGNINLPFTGGQGLVGLLIVGGLATAVGSSIVIRRRKSSNEA